MTENDVKVIVGATLDTYEEKTGEPRHKENTAKFDLLFGTLNRIKGAAWTFGTILSGIKVYSLYLEFVKK